MIITRFAPSPTGMLHIGSVRTAIFSYLYTKQNNGKFLLRIEDTDKQRSTQQAVDVILNGMRILGLNWDGPEVYQSANEEKHKQIALQLVQKGLAYYAYDTKDELEQMRALAEKEGRAFIYRFSEKSTMPRPNVEPVVRLKVNPHEKIVVEDIVKGPVEFDTANIEDFIILRSNLTPIYMLAVVVDDVEMQITHIIRGDDHLTNTPKQILLYKAMGCKVPCFAHIPLICDAEGKKLSKRKGAAAVEEYIAMGFLPQALLNYLVKLGWSHEQDFLTKPEMIELFNLSKVSHSPARFDLDKLLNVNLHYISQLSFAEIMGLILQNLQNFKNAPLNETDTQRLEKIMPELKKNKNLLDICKMAQAYLTNCQLEKSPEALQIISQKQDILQNLHAFLHQKLQTSLNIEFKPFFDEFLLANNLKFKDVGPLFRACLIGSLNSTAIGEIFSSLAPSECLLRLKSCIEQ